MSEIIIDVGNNLIELVGCEYRGELVRCKECKYCRPMEWNNEWYGSCRWFNTHSVQADDYCSYGVKKGADDERSNNESAVIFR